MKTLFVQGPTDHYLKVPVGEASQDLLTMARDGLRTKLSSAIREALQTGRDTTSTGTVTHDRRRMPVTITAHPMVVNEVNLVLLTFVVKRVIEPFFTTKDIGAGSGLGLSMVYGFAKQSGGHLAVYSEEGLGTTVTLYLDPSMDDDASTVIPVTHEIPQLRRETILVVEDD